ncbi:MerR family transcriptional regulator [Jeotgalibacillus sp. ET6]|uniref:MerR family transcriptional regulator n=1 Tax=Jeotgalibacillus sp. ET6 TaxID=3037260 RepID=UPI002418692E|nr:MerR family transcriptional regulator [Jeotgalibacillus sp. ET6]MDG5472087.1 MerR family transcriptional regulator [Jeotgalibacillus sp. ET6]
MYTINEVEKMYDIPSSTLRFYEKEGILPKITRNSSGRRVYKAQELEWLELVMALKDTGMPLETIKDYLSMHHVGDNTLDQRRKTLTDHKQLVEKQLAMTIKHLEKINRKITFYDLIILKKNPRDL